MNIQQESRNNHDVNSSPQADFDFKGIAAKYLFHWPVFLVGVIFALGVAVIYLRYTKPMYEVSSTLLIKDDKNSVPENDLLEQLDLSGGSKVVENEVEILRSKTLMGAVVKRLQLNVNLIAEGRVVDASLYEKRPVKFSVLDDATRIIGKQFRLSFPNDSTYMLTDIEKGIKVAGSLNSYQRNVFGTYKVEKTSFFKQDGVFSLIINDPNKVVNSFLSQLAISVASKQSTVLKLTYQTTIPEQGEDIINTLIQVYNEASLEDKNRITQNTLHFIDERLALITGELVEVEKDVEGFKSSQGLTDISSQAAVYLENVKVNDAKVNEVSLQLDVIKDIKEYLQSETGEGKLPSTLGIEDPVVLSQIEQLRELQTRRINLLNTTQPNNPIFNPLDEQIRATRDGIASNISNIEKSLKGTLQGLRGYNNQYEGSIKKIPRQERQYISIKRQQSIKESLYLYLLQKKEESALSFASSVADSRIVDPALSDSSPVKPMKRIVYLAAILVGLILPAAYIYLKDLFNDKIRSSDEIKNITLSPIIGEILLDESNERIVVLENNRSAVAEQFRAIRTNMDYLSGRRKVAAGKVTLFTSSTSGEGKSFVAINFAASMAISGRKTVILELDLRKPKVSKYMNLSGNVGLSNFLVGSSTIYDLVQPSNVIPNLNVIGSGPIPPNPSELLLENSIDQLIEFLRSEYDEIVIDTPPIGLVTDAQILSRLADVSIYIVRHGFTSKQQLNKFNDLYQQGVFPNFNIIFNGIDTGSSYGYGYGYGYGYYSDPKPRVLGLNSLMKAISKRF